MRIKAMLLICTLAMLGLVEFSTCRASGLDRSDSVVALLGQQATATGTSSPNGDSQLAINAVSSVEQASEQSGYRTFLFTFSVKNQSSQWFGIPAPGSASQEIVPMPAFHIQVVSAEGYHYPDEPMDVPMNSILPPGFQVLTSASIDVAQTATALELNVDGPTSHSYALSSLPTQTPSGLVQYPSSGYARIGDTITQGPLDLHITRIQIRKGCELIGQGTWNFDVRYSISNKYGYPLGPDYIAFYFFDATGTLWGGKGNQGLSVPPGETSDFIQTGPLSEINIHDSNCEGQPPALPLKMLVVIPPLSSADGALLSPEVVKMYDVGMVARGADCTLPDCQSETDESN